MKALLPLGCFLLLAVTPVATVAIGETQRVGTLRVTPLAVKEDSRCPENVQCVWAGRAIVHVAIVDRGRRYERDLELSRPSHGVVLDAVLPRRVIGGGRPAPYRFHFSPA